MKFEDIFDKRGKEPVFIAGPCSAETEEQVLKTAVELSEIGIDLFRAGIWKPRTRPNSFEGVGTDALKWLQRVQSETGLKTSVEVANGQHVQEALKYGVDVLWIGARTTVNPFSVQEIAEALRGVDIPVMVKNPIHADLSLWKGAIERIYNIGIPRIAAIHRGFSSFGDSKYRNQPRWQLAIELKREFPDLTFICDSSHICGRRDNLESVSQQALDLSYDGIMLEVHPNPDTAWSDAAQQITPSRFKEIKENLIYRQRSSKDPVFLENLHNLRQQIDEIDEEMISLLGARMVLAERIGSYKKDNNISILQPKRWDEIMERGLEKGKLHSLSDEFVRSFLDAIHQESINHQSAIMNRANKGADA